MQLSYWEYQTYFSKVDLLVVGSGIVGLNAALAYKKKHPKSTVLVVERGFLPNGASTKNAGFCCFGSVSELADDLRHSAENAVWDTVRMRYQGLKTLRKRIPDLQMNYEHSGGYEVFDTKKDFEASADLISSFNKKMKEILGLNRVYVVDAKKTQNSFFSGFKYCIKNQYEGQLNTGMMMQTLLNKARKKGIIILNGLLVEKIQDNGRAVEICLQNKLIVSSKKALIATNGFAQQLIPGIELKPARAQVLVTAPIKKLKIKGSFHYQQGYYYFRNIDNRILLGGGRNLDFAGETSTDMHTTRLIQQKLEQLLQNNIVPKQSYTIEQRWSGIMGVGNEKKPIVTKISPNVVCAVRMGGMGVAIGSLVGDMAAEMLDEI
ncbi:MAG: FAD-dependent oxidoreductase [Bacteroidetes bacterium]|nr:FAD-dependent oxidoreductase [Bacteroidota bacterium]